MLGSGPGSLVFSRIWADRRLLVVVALLSLTATVLIALGPLTSRAVVDAGLSAQVGDAAPAVVGIEVAGKVASAEDAAAINRILTSIGAEFGAAPVQILQSRSHAFAPDLIADDRVVTNLAALTESVGLLRWVSGEAPDLNEAALHRDAADMLNLAIGDEVRFDDDTPSLTVAGIFVAEDSSDRYWWRSADVRDGVVGGVSFTTVGPVVVNIATLLEIEAEPRGQWRLLANPVRVDAANAVTLRDWPWVVEQQLIAAGLDNELRIETDLPTFFRDVEKSIASSRTTVTAVLGLLAAMAIPALLIAAGMLLEHRRSQHSTLVGRGMSRGQLSAASVFETAVIALLVGLLTIPVASALLVATSRFGPDIFGGLQLTPVVTSGVWAANILGVLLAMAVLASQLIPRRSPHHVRALRSRNEAAPWLQRTKADLGIIVLCAVGLWQLRQDGAAEPTEGLQPVVVLAPALAITAGALAALRAVRFVSSTGALFADRSRSLTASLALRTIGRSPAATTRSVLLVLIAVAVAGFAFIHSSTWSTSQRDQAAAEVGFDGRIEADISAEHVPFGYLSSAYESLDGIDHAVAALRDTAEIGSLEVDLLLVDAAGLVAVSTPDDEVSNLLARAVESDSSNLGGLLLGDALRFEVDLLAESRGERVDGLVDVSVLVADGDGHFIRLTGSSVAIDGGVATSVVAFEQTIEGVGRVTVRPPITLLDVEVSMPAGFQDGIVEEDGTTFPSSSPEEAAIDVTVGEWRVDGSPILVQLANDRATASKLAQQQGEARIRIDNTSEASTLKLNGGLSRGVSARAVFRIPVAPWGSDRPTPVIVTPQVLAAQGLRVGDTALLSMGRTEIAIEIRGTVPTVPGYPRSRAAVLGDLASASRAARASDQDVPKPRTHLLTTDRRALSDDLRIGPFARASVVTTQERAAQLSQDPLQLGVVVSLAMGFVAAAISALVGLVASAVSGARRRSSDDALLRALGAPRRIIRRLLVIESALVVGIAVTVGVAIAIVSSALILPTLSTTAEGLPAVPSPTLVIPWRWIFTMVASVAITVLIIPLLVERALARRDPATVLRLGEAT